MKKTLPWFLLLLGTTDHYFKTTVVNALESPQRTASACTPLTNRKVSLPKHQKIETMSMRGGAAATTGGTGSSIPMLPQSVVTFWLDAWQSSKKTVFVLAKPVQSIVLYQPPLGIVTWWVSYQWLQRLLFPHVDPLHRFWDGFPLLHNKYQTNKRPKSVELDALDRDYNTLGGVQAHALRQHLSSSSTDLAATNSPPPRASRFQCAQHSVEVLIEQQSSLSSSQDPLAVLLEVRALDSLLRCVRDNHLLPWVDRLRTRQQDCEAQLTVYHTSSRQWLKRTLQTILANLGTRLGRPITIQHPWSLQEWRNHYQDTLQTLQEQYERLGRLQELLLEQPQQHNIESSDSNNNSQYLEVCSQWNTQAKLALQDLLARHNANHHRDDDDDDVSIVRMITTRNTNWDAEHWKAALKCVDVTQHNAMNNNRNNNNNNNNNHAAFSFWGIVTHQWKQRNMVSALLKIALAKAIHLAILPHYGPNLKTTAHQVAAAVWGIVEFRFYVPLKVIVMDLLNRRPRLLDPAQLVNEQTSLQNMLRDLGISVDDETNSNVDALAEASRMYEQQLKHGAVKNMVFGNMVRLLLIQVQQLKAELLEAFQSIDELVDANRLNVSLLATIPAFLLVRWGSRILYALLYRFRVRDLTGLTEAHRELTSRLRTLERLLILADDGPLKGPQLGEFISQEQRYLMLLDYCQPPFPVKQIDSIYQDMQDLLPPGGLDRATQLNLLNLIHQKNADLIKSL